MIGNFKRFDFQKKPLRQRNYLRPIVWALSYPAVWSHKTKIIKTGIEGLKPPYLILCNHNAFLDFMVLSAAIFPHRANYVVAIDGFLINEWLLRNVGCIGNRKFTNSIALVKNIIRAKNNGDIVALYPEARYSLCGTQSELPQSVGKLIKMMGVPVATLICHGHHVNSPFWRTGNQGVKRLEAEFTLLLTAGETKTLPVPEINKKIADAMVYDDFAWQKANNIRIENKNRAEGLHKVLYQCPACGAEYKMSSAQDELYCGRCGKRWRMTELGELEAVSGSTEFSHIPDWYEWERENVRREVENGTYSFSAKVRVDSLPNAKKFVDLGEGMLIHNMDGFVLTGEYQGEPYEERWAPKALYACHIEYNYAKKGDCIDLNNIADTLYIYPKGENFSVTKIALATEELHKKALRAEKIKEAASV